MKSNMKLENMYKYVTFNVAPALIETVVENYILHR